MASSGPRLVFALAAFAASVVAQKVAAWAASAEVTAFAALVVVSVE